ncbi:MAG: type II secretion system protein J [Rhodospirillales bacterium]
MRRRGDRVRGFTLLEVLVAFTILSLMLAVVLQVFSGGLRTTEIARNHVVAVLLAESLLAAIGVEEPLAEGDLSGVLDDGFRWHAVVERYREGEDGDDEQGEIVPYRLSLTVAWGSPGPAGSVTLTTLRLGIAGDDAGIGDPR